jgi:Ca2+-binding EF-hand superfamily protein
MKKPLLQCTGAVLCAVFGACQSITTQGDNFAEADTSHDGNLSLEEVNTFLVKDVFRSRDTNHDGKVTLSEWRGPGQEKEFRARDANGDGALTLEDVQAYGRTSGNAKKLMKGADTDRNGSLSRAEVKAYYAAREGPAR